MDDTARTQRRHQTMDAMRPSQAFGAPPAPSMYDPWHLMRQLLGTLRAASAVVMRRRPSDGTPSIRVRS